MPSRCRRRSRSRGWRRSSPALKEQGWRSRSTAFAPEVQRWALAQGVDYLNDIQGFPDAALYPELAAVDGQADRHAFGAGARRRARASMCRPQRSSTASADFFDARIAALTAAGIARERLILDPGMGLFLGTDPEASFTVLRRLPELKAAFGLPLLVSVSRKSFLRKLVGPRRCRGIGPASLAAELFAVRQGADYIRTHDPGALRDALNCLEKLLTAT